MESYPIDIDAAQVLRWLKAESAIAPGTFRIAASRSQEARTLAVTNEAHLGDEEREDLGEIDTIATLEIVPVHAHEGWRLKVIVEDEVGPRMVDESADEHAIDLGTFYGEFIRRGRGVANVVAEVDDPAAKQRLTRLLVDIERNRHVRDGGESSAAKPPRRER